MSGFPFNDRNLVWGLKQFLLVSEIELDGKRWMSRPTVLPGSFNERLGLYSLRTFIADIQFQGFDQAIGLTLKEGTHELIKAELQFYKRLAENLSFVVYTPRIVNGDEERGWSLFQLKEHLIEPQKWSFDDYRTAADNLAKLHHFSWDQGDMLDAFGGLDRPLDRDYKAMVEQSITAAHRLVMEQPLIELREARYYHTFEALITLLDDITAPLKEQTFALIHGDYWADNVACPNDGGRQMITCWHFAAIAPAILDIVFFHQQTLAFLNEHIKNIPLDAVLLRYRGKLGELHRNDWEYPNWDDQWDHALLFMFIWRWLGWLAQCPQAIYSPLHDDFKRGWLDPVIEILRKRFGVNIPD